MQVFPNLGKGSVGVEEGGMNIGLEPSRDVATSTEDVGGDDPKRGMKSVGVGTRVVELKPSPTTIITTTTTTVSMETMAQLGMWADIITNHSKGFGKSAFPIKIWGTAKPNDSMSHKVISIQTE